ncbi:hypothetical protein A0H81_08633 [Grifola frondosa]|uniref:Cep57 centrosome microtubule-binding domain-containing protein n=1 Tax=Grifola frondosa TaxID=5627 RepID=A0A1C7M4B6_GRIFR|nr:hypothetical protein A0H81_08633 [Grifola frondosa]
MSRRSSNFEFSIQGDELEQNRIQLEHNLQHTDLSLHLSSNPDDDDYSDVEYPRHNSAPSPLPVFASFEHRSGDQFDQDEPSRHHAWSYRTVDDDEGVNPYGGETISTAAHHASALTLSAGLGGRATRRDVSLSGAEYDPDRPLQGILSSMNTRFSRFDVDSTKSKHITSNVVDFDPLVVNDTAELDRVLESGHRGLPASRYPHSSTPSASSDSEPPSPHSDSRSPRPKLSDALHHVAFSPKRPRTLQSQARQPMVRPSSAPAEQDTGARPPPRTNQSLSYVQQTSITLPANPKPPTPLTANNSRFTKLARGLTKEIEEEQTRAINHPSSRYKPVVGQGTIRESRAGKQNMERNPFRDIVNHVNVTVNPVPTPPKSARSRTPFKSRVHLPDVTGLTSAVGSPLRAGLEYYGYDAKEAGEHEAHLHATLGAVQSRLAYLESENSISRRRVQELELELEACKKDVHEDAAGRDRQRLAELERLKKSKARTSNRELQAEAEERAVAERRYKAAVEEKKALEALIATLRAHLARLTSELSDHQDLLTELRSLRDSDARTLAEKSKEVDRLREEVERLAGEVEVLRGVVEEGLKERRVAREQHSREGSPDALVEPSENEARLADMTHRHEDHEPQDEEEDEGNSSSSSDRPATPSPPSRSSLEDRTVRTDHATQGSSHLANALSCRAFVDSVEMDRISTEIGERRSERSGSALGESHSSSKSRSPSPPRMKARVKSPIPASHDLDHGTGINPHNGYDVGGIGRARNRVASGSSIGAKIPSRTSSPAPRPLRRPTTPTPGTAALGKSQGSYDPPRPRSQNQTASAPPVQTPFPQIRGARLERLFFSAPEHNAQTCKVCHRRRRWGFPGEDQNIPFWMTDHKGKRDFRTKEQDHDNDDEGFAEGPEDNLRSAYPRYQHRAKGKERAHREADKVPPQTVLARVLREIEDDFTHYKSIYVELADQYKDMDAVSNVAKRNVLADHLRDVIDILEQKGDQIASLYDLLTFKDKPAEEAAMPHNNDHSPPARTRNLNKHPTFA